MRNKAIRFLRSRILAGYLQHGYSLMDQISVMAAAGMQARMQSLDLVANNLANSSTGGYKSDGEFYTLFTSEAAGEDASGPSAVPMIQRQWTDFKQGLLEPTNNPLDFGLSGKGYFVVQGPSGPLYTRNGNFRFSNHRWAGHRRRIPAAPAKWTALQSRHVTAVGCRTQWRHQPERKIHRRNPVSRFSKSRWPHQVWINVFFQYHRRRSRQRKRRANLSRKDRSVQCQRRAWSRAHCRLVAAVRNDAKGHHDCQRHEQTGYRRSGQGLKVTKV